MNQKKILLISLSGWMHVARLPKVLNDAGFEVAALCFKVDMLQYSQYLNARYYLEGTQNNASILSAVVEVFESFRADYVIFTDQQGVEAGQVIYKMLQHPSIKNGKDIREVIGLSLGHPDYFDALLKKSKASDLMHDLDQKIPLQIASVNNDGAYSFAENNGYPIIIKSNLQVAGSNCWLCQDEVEVKAVLAAGLEVDFTVQEYISGRTVLYVALASQGDVLAEITYMKEQAYPSSLNNTSVAKVVDHKGISASSKKFIAETEFSGYISLSYIIDDISRETYFVACNPWSTPLVAASHLVGVNMFTSLLESLAGESSYSAVKPSLGKCVALYPQEWERDINSPYLLHAIHDVPWGEPLLLKKYMDYVLQAES